MTLAHAAAGGDGARARALARAVQGQVVSLPIPKLAQAAAADWQAARVHGGYWQLPEQVYVP